MYVLPVYLYWLSFILLILFGRHFGFRGAAFLSCVNGLLCTLVVYVMFFEVSLNSSPCSLTMGPWFIFDVIEVRWIFFFDSLSTSMLLIVATVSWCAVAYSIEYMCDDPHLTRFLAYLSLFTFFMVILVTSNNIIQLFVGWEGVGICSYLLINFWYTRTSANKSAILAVLSNKVGDIALLISFGLLFCTYKTFDLPSVGVCTVYGYGVGELLDSICYLFLVGAVAKSAQLGLHIWLPEAMEGPTPVSSLIHAATMVTAGIFLLVRFSFLLERSSTTLVVCVFLGSCTVFFGSSIGIFLFDIKRIIAYSTCSQLGYMLMACGFSNYSCAMFHLIGHAFFKALLFLTAGYIIHFCEGEQDFRKLGGLIHLIPSAYMFMLIGSLSLIGFPFMTGFITKETLLDAVHSYDHFIIYDIASFCQFLAVFSIVFSVWYSIRLLSGIFFGIYNGFRYRLFVFDYSGFLLLIALFKLCCLSICFGYLTKDFFVGPATCFLMQSPQEEIEQYRRAAAEVWVVPTQIASHFWDYADGESIHIFMNPTKQDYVYRATVRAFEDAVKREFDCYMRHPDIQYLWDPTNKEELLDFHLTVGAETRPHGAYLVYNKLQEYYRAHSEGCRAAGTISTCLICDHLNLRPLAWYEALWRWIVDFVKDFCNYVKNNWQWWGRVFLTMRLVTERLILCWGDRERKGPIWNVNELTEKDTIYLAGAIRDVLVYSAAEHLLLKIMDNWYLVDNLYHKIENWVIRVLDYLFDWTAQKQLKERLKQEALGRFYSTVIDIPIFPRDGLTVTSASDHPEYVEVLMFCNVDGRTIYTPVDLRDWFERRKWEIEYAEFNKHLRGVLIMCSIYFMGSIIFLFVFARRLMSMYRLRLRSFYTSMFVMLANRYPLFHKYLVSGTSRRFLYFSRHTGFLLSDRGVVETLSAHGVVSFMRHALFRYTKLKTGIIYHYSGFFLLVLIVVMLFLVGSLS